MATSNYILAISIVFAAVALFLTSDLCQPYRETVGQSLPPEVRSVVDRMSVKISTTFEEVFGLPMSTSMEKLAKNYPDMRNEAKKISYPVFSKQELQQYTGADENKPVYLGILGRVFDVSTGRRHYGKDGGYSFFSGRDGTRAFVSGEFNDEGLVDTLDGLSVREYADLQQWLEFYEKDYVFVGVVDGNFYDQDGQPTEALHEFEEGLKLAELEKEQEADDQTRFPPCNSEWSSAAGGRVWCSNRSGGIERDWIGVPRLYKKPGHRDTRCACIRTFGPPSDGSNPNGDRGDLHSPLFKLYDGCPPDVPSCKLPD